MLNAIDTEIKQRKSVINLDISFLDFPRFNSNLQRIMKRLAMVRLDGRFVDAYHCVKLRKLRHPGKLLIEVVDKKFLPEFFYDDEEEKNLITDGVSYSTCHFFQALNNKLGCAMVLIVVEQVIIFETGQNEIFDLVGL